MSDQSDDKSDSKPNRVTDFAKPLRVLVGLTFCTIVSLTIAQVFFRFVLDSPLVWSEELVRLLLVWMTFIGAAVVCWDGRHLNVDVLFLRMPAKARRGFRMFNVVLALIFLGLVIWGGYPLIELGYYVEIGALDLSEMYYRLPGLIGAALMIIFILLRAVYRWRESRNGPDDNITAM